MFTHDASKFKDALPNADEGDALLDQLFDVGDESSAEPSKVAPETDSRETETRVRSSAELVARGGGTAAPGEAPDSEERETLFFERWVSEPDALDDAPESVVAVDQTGTVVLALAEETATVAVLAVEDVLDLSPSYPVQGLPSDRGSTEMLGVDDVELLPELPDEFGEPSSAEGPWEKVGDLPTTRVHETGGVSDAVTTFPVEEPTAIPPDDGPDQPPSIRSRGAFPVVHLPPMAEFEAMPEPARSVPFALVPLPRPSEDGVEVVFDDDDLLGDDDMSAPASRASLVAARESVAGWLSAADPGRSALEVEEFVISLDDVEDVPPSVLPVPPAREPLESIEIFADSPADLEAAVVSLVERGERKAWLERAEWLRAQAPVENASARASALLVVSELFAIGGEFAEAEKLAAEALQLAPTSPMVQRQFRGLLAARRAWPEVVAELTREARTAPNDPARAHAAYLAAEIARLKLDDADGSIRMVERASAADSEDVRAPLARWVANASELDAALDAPKGSAEAAFVAAEAELASFRSNGVDGANAQSRYGRLLAARAGLRRREAAAAVSLLLDVGREPGLGAAAAWLAAVLGAPNAELRGRVSGALELARNGTHAPMAKRLAVAYAFERGDSDAVAAALRSSDALPPNDRLLLAAMLPASAALPPVAELLSASSATSAAEEPLVAAARAVFGDRMLPSEPGTQPSFALARTLCSLGPELPLAEAHGALAGTVDALLEREPASGVARAFVAERDFLAGQVGTLLDSLAGGTAEERALAASLFAELSRDSATMMQVLAPLAAKHPLALRMFVTHATDAEAVDVLASTAATSDDRLGAQLLIEAASRTRELGRIDALVARAYERNERDPIVPLLGLSAALRTGAHALGRQWLARCNLEPLQTQILEALRLVPDDSPERSSLLAEAHRQKPRDFSLRALCDASQVSTSGRAAWLEDRAGEADADRPDLAIEAALLYELDDDLTAAARAVSLARTALGHSIARRLALRGHGSEAVAEQLESARLRAEDPDERRDLAADLARIESNGHRDAVRAAERWRAVLDTGSADVPSLLEAGRLFFEHDDPKTQAVIEHALARVTTDGEAVAHAMVAVRRALASEQTGLALDAARIAATSSRRGAWSLRQLGALAYSRRDVEGMWRSACDLAERTARPLERAALLCRAAEAAFAAGDDASGTALLTDVFAVWPRHPVARLLKAAVLERSGAKLQAAIAYEELAGMTRSRRERAQRCYKAASLWLGSNDPRAATEGQRLLEAACDLDPEHLAAFERLQAIYLAGGARMELAELLSQRVRSVADPNARGELEVLRGRMLAEAGASGEAKVALAASLKVRPDDVSAWRAYAEVAITEQDGEAAEQALLQLGRLVTDVGERVDVYLRLGDVYTRLRPNHERARRAYREAEKLDPTRVAVRERYIELQAAMGDPQGAIAAQRALCGEATNPRELCARTVALAWLFERMKELSEAEKILVELRRQQPLEPQALRALHAFYLRQSKRGLAEGVLERIPLEVARLVVAGRLEPAVFDMAKAVAELRGRTDAVAVAEAVMAAAHGGDARLGAAGARAANGSLDDQFAPEVFGPELRELLAATGYILDAAAPFDSRAMRTRPLTHHDELVARAREIAAHHGLGEVDFVLANALPAVVMPVSMWPAVFCIGAPLLDPGNAPLFDLAFHRAANLVRTRTAALARTAPIAQWPLFAAYLRMHDPSIVVAGVEPAKLAEFEAAMRAAAPADFAPDARQCALARYVFESIGVRGSSLGANALAWSWHVACVAGGDVGLALEAMAVAAGPQTLPPAGEERLRWLAKHLEARELLGFLIGDPHLEVRSRLGLLVPMKS
jgi:hypothetical protein